jgi:hypothetical protein
MKAGRPSYHIPSRWVTVLLNDGLTYFELDKKGNIVKPSNGAIVPHHVMPIVAPPVQPIERQVLVVPEIPVNPVSRDSPSPFAEFEPMDDFFSIQDWRFPEEKPFDFS